MFCANCGETLSDGAKFCPKCGGRVEVPSVRPVTSGESSPSGFSLFAFSEENWNRPQDEVSRLMELFALSMKNELDNFLKNGVRFVVLGNRERFSENLNSAIDEMMRSTAAGSALTLVVFLSYSGRWDILQAARKLAVAHPDGNFGMEEISSALVTSGIPDPDLLIRTGGELRLSNYLLWQCAYAELYFCDTFWPEFDEEELCKAIYAYQQRERRFGKTSEQVAGGNDNK